MTIFAGLFADDVGFQKRTPQCRRRNRRFRSGVRQALRGFFGSRASASFSGALWNLLPVAGGRCILLTEEPSGLRYLAVFPCMIPGLGQVSA